MGANPSATWYFNDWDSDIQLKLCSLAAQGLWMRMLCICARAGGYLMIDEKPCSIEELSVAVGRPVAEIEPLIKELEARRIFSRARNEVIYNRRMVRDAKASQANRENGRKGGTVTRDKRRGIFGSPEPSSERGPEPERKPAANPVSEPVPKRKAEPSPEPSPSPSLLLDSLESLPASSEPETRARTREAERLLAARFLELRDQLWPGSMPLASLTIQSQSGEYLAMGLDEHELWTLIEREARRCADAGKRVINSLRFFRGNVLDAVAEKRNRQRLNGDHPPEKIEPPLWVTWRVWIKNWIDKGEWHESQRVEDCPRQILEDNRAALEANPPPGLRVKARVARETTQDQAS